MSNELLFVIAAAAIVLLAVVLLRRRPTGSSSVDLERIRELEGELVALRDARSEVERRLAAEERTATRVPELERTLARITGEKAELEVKMARLTESLAQERKQAEEKLALLGEARERMSKEFKVLAEEIMARHGENFTKQNREQVEGLLTPLRDKLVEFQQGLQNTHTESLKDRATLAAQIKQLTEQSARMSSETQNLTKALKGEARVQGAWGEMILSTILERSGLREGEEYVTQESHAGEDGGRLRPDVIVNVPGGQRVVIDSKVSLTAYEAWVGAETEAERAACMSRHVESIKAHIRALGSKAYPSATGSGLDYVVMFVPIEGALAAALHDEPGLIGFAAEHNVAISTPTTLMVALRTIASIWQVERRNRNADEIAARAGKLYDKFVGFVGDMQKLGDSLDAARRSYDGALGKLSTGNGNIVRQVEMLKQMGAKTAKAIPPSLLDDALDALPSLVGAPVP